MVTIRVPIVACLAALSGLCTSFVFAEDFGAGAAVNFERVVRLDPKNEEAMAQEAWLLATSPDPKVRDGKKAIEMARKLCETTDWKKAHYMGILAAAYAEDGKFDDAVKFQEKALEDPDYSANWGREALKWLSLYKSKKPNHQN